LNEQELITALRAGEENAYRTLFSQHSDRVYNTALSLLQQEQDAEDITQEVFMEVFRSIKNFRQQSSLSTWIYRVTLSKCMDQQKKQRAIKRFSFITSLFGKDQDLLHDQPHFDHPGILAEQKEQARILFIAVRKLPEKQQAAYTLHKVEGLSHKEVAEVMETSVSAIESLIFRANENLKNLLSVYYKKM
jgi:RNA polymerase sigma-70 factor (ECF subfamily)